MNSILVGCNPQVWNKRINPTNTLHGYVRSSVRPFVFPSGCHLLTYKLATYGVLSNTIGFIWVLHLRTISISEKNTDGIIGSTLSNFQLLFWHVVYKISETSQMNNGTLVNLLRRWWKSYVKLLSIKWCWWVKCRHVELLFCWWLALFLR